jgi:uncharacterized protein (TIGR04255 family)
VTEAAPSRIVYPYPPVVEVICQVTFKEPVSWSVATPGLLWKALQADYPAEPTTLSGVQATFDGNEGEFKVNPQNARFVFSNLEQSRRVVANESCLSVNGLSPYEEWPNVASRFRHAIDRFNVSVAPFVPATVNIRYINRIVIPLVQLDLSEYFTVPIATPHQDGAVVQGFVSRSQAIIPDSGVVITITFGSAPHGVPDEAAFILDIELTVPVTGASSTDDLIMAVNELHRLENREFESSITDKCRSLFDGHGREE